MSKGWRFIWGKAAVLYNNAGGLADLQQTARRLLANIMLANGDAHLKNWTVIYSDGRHARLSSAYDIVSAPYLAIKAHLDDAIIIARQTWPEMLTSLPMNEAHKQVLRNHWAQLHTDFRL